jgi:hypothetical protein
MPRFFTRVLRFASTTRAAARASGESLGDDGNSPHFTEVKRKCCFEVG